MATDGIKIKAPVSTYKVELGATYEKADFDLIDGCYVVLVEGGVSGNTRAGWVRGVVPITKDSAIEVIAKGDKIEYVSKNTVQKFAAGTKVGRAYEASANGDVTVMVELMPELN